MFPNSLFISHSDVGQSSLFGVGVSKKKKKRKDA